MKLAIKKLSDTWRYEMIKEASTIWLEYLEVQFLFNIDDLYGLFWRSSFHRNITFCCHKDNGKGGYKKINNVPLNSEKKCNGERWWPLSFKYHLQHFWENDDVSINDDLGYIVLYLIKAIITVDENLI